MSERVQLSEVLARGEGRHPFTACLGACRAEPEVLSALVRLEPHNLYPSLLVFVVWLSAAQYGRLSKAKLARLHRGIRDWHLKVNRPFSNWVSKLQNNVSSNLSRTLISFIREDSQLAEQIEQRLLIESMLGMHVKRRNAEQCLSDACYNVAQLIKLMRSSCALKDSEALYAVVNFIFAECSMEDVEQHMSVALQSVRALGVDPMSGKKQLALSL